MTTIKVREQEIFEGQYGCNRNCAVALAINNVMKRRYYVSVTGRSIRIYQEDMNPAYLDRSSDELIAWFPMPVEVEQFVRDYDYPRPVQPIEFNLDIPSSLLR